MEGEQRSMRMLMQTMPKKGFVLTFGVFFVLLIACVVIGSLGPEVYEESTVSSYDCPPGQTTFDPIACNGVDLMQNGTFWIGEIRQLDKLNQELYLTMNIISKLKDQAGVDTDIWISVNVDGRNGDDEPWESMVFNDTHKRPIKCVLGKNECDDVIVVHEIYIRFSSYRVNISMSYGRGDYDISFIGDINFTYTYVAHSYTLFELWFRFAFLVITFIILIVYSYRLKGYSWHEWTFEQKWGAVLLFGLMAYNNPFYALEIVASGWFPIFLNRLLYASFLVLLLYFWLILFDGIRKEASERNFKGFYLPKIVLLGLFWITGIVVFTWVELHEKDDPLYSAADELPGYIFFQVFLLILLIVYIFWLIYSTCRACGDIKTLPYLGVRIKFFGIFTLLVILTVVGGLIFGYGAKVNSAAEFLSFLSLFNLYVYTLAFVYLPSQVVTTAPAPRTERIGMVRLEEDDPVEMTNVGGRA